MRISEASKVRTSDSALENHSYLMTIIKIRDYEIKLPN